MSRLATALTGLSALLASSAIGTVAVGWFWPSARGDWQAVLVWAYWLGAPVSSVSALALAGREQGRGAPGPERRPRGAATVLDGQRRGASARLNAALLVLWGALSLLLGILPFGG